MNGQSLNLFGFPITKFVVDDWSEKKPKLLKLINFTDNDIVECQTDYYKYQTSAPYLKEFVDTLQTDLDKLVNDYTEICLLYTSPSPRDATLSRMPSSA